MWIKAPASYSSTGDPIILLFSVGCPVSGSLYCKKSPVDSDSASLSHEGDCSRGLFSEDAAGGCTSRSSPEAEKLSYHALRYEAEVSLDSIRYVTEASPGLNRKVTETYANFPWIMPPLLQGWSHAVCSNMHSDVMETCLRKRALPGGGGDASLQAETSTEI